MLAIYLNYMLTGMEWEIKIIDHLLACMPIDVSPKFSTDVADMPYQLVK